MDKVIELAKKVGLDSVNGKVYTWAGQHNVTEELKKFYTLARADLEAELLEQARIVGMGGERELKLMAENAKLRKALSPFVLANSSEEHMTLIVRTADITAARAALGENK